MSSNDDLDRAQAEAGRLAAVRKAVEPPDRAPSPPEETGPVSWVNWRRFVGGVESEGWVEYGFYTDTWLIGNVTTGLGPYALLNAIAHAESRHSVSMNLVLRAEIHLRQALPTVDPRKTDTANWTDLSHADQLAALTSLAYGMRCRSGGDLRESWNDSDASDPRGRPSLYLHRAPVLPEPGMLGPVLPRLGGAGSRWQEQLTKTVRLEDGVRYLAAFPELDRDDAVSLLRAARLYQLGVWDADADPETAWLRLVSACEVAADHMFRNSDVDVVDALRESFPSTYEAALKNDSVQAVADELAGVTRSTKKFRDFVMRFAPVAPDERPEAAYQLDWTSLQKAIGTVYGHRSKALHVGQPFPAPMLRPPAQPDLAEAPAEIPLNGLSVGASAWRPQDAPMLLTTFEYVVSHCLRGWWLSMRDGSASQA